MRASHLLLIPLLPALLLGSETAPAANEKIILNTGIDYSSGKFGSQSRTETWAVPVSLKYRTDDWYARISTSFLHVRGDGNVTPDGDPLDNTGTSASETGMGDVSVGLAYTLLDERNAPVSLDLGGKIKFGTASVSKFLGTGENDYSLFAEIYKSFGRWAPFLNLGYKWKGDPEGIAYRDVWFGSAGIQYRLTPTLSAGGSYDWQQAVTSTSAAVSEATLYLNFKLNTSNRLNLYLVGGFSDASPDWGSGVMFSRIF